MQVSFGIDPLNSVGWSSGNNTQPSFLQQESSHKNLVSTQKHAGMTRLNQCTLDCMKKLPNFEAYPP
jgi:hypothetical protein